MPSQLPISRISAEAGSGWRSNTASQSHRRETNQSVEKSWPRAMSSKAVLRDR